MKGEEQSTQNILWLSSIQNDCDIIDVESITNNDLSLLLPHAENRSGIRRCEAAPLP